MEPLANAHSVEYGKAMTEPKSSKKMSMSSVLLKGLQRVKRNLAWSLSSHRSKVASDSASIKTFCNNLYNQPLYKEKLRKDRATWQFSTPSVQPELFRTTPVDAEDDGDSFDSGSLCWARSGSWPSEFSDKVVGGGDAPRAAPTKRLSLYERWFEANKEAVHAAQKRVKYLKRTPVVSSVLNAARLKQLYEQNHQDDRQDAIQGKKFTYAWILEQEALVPLRLDNLRRGLPAHQLHGVEQRKYADVMNAVYKWEKDVNFEPDEDECN